MPHSSRTAGPKTERVLVVSDKLTATQIISFLNPLSQRIETGELSVSFATAGKFGSALVKSFRDAEPGIVVLSRCTKASATELLQHARSVGTPCIYHIDDDLLNVPHSIGEAKAGAYNDAERVGTLRELISGCDVLYTSTKPLAAALAEFGNTVEIFAGDVYCSVDAEALPPPLPSPWPIIGYMGSSTHVNDLQLVVPAIERLMQEFSTLRFELFGGVPMPESLAHYGSRVQSHTGDTNYIGFLRKLQSLGWWIGLAPLEDNVFNRCKADTKWVEYSSAGIVTVASGLPVYERACSDGTGILAGSGANWYDALRHLLTSEHARRSMLGRAQEKLREQYGHERLARQILEVFARAREVSAARR